jgi:hypothetical protein
MDTEVVDSPYTSVRYLILSILATPYTKPIRIKNYLGVKQRRKILMGGVHKGGGQVAKTHFSFVSALFANPSVSMLAFSAEINQDKHIFVQIRLYV